MFSHLSLNTLIKFIYPAKSTKIAGRIAKAAFKLKKESPKAASFKFPLYIVEIYGDQRPF